MIDPIQSLSFAIQSKPKAYAILLGSGISKAAGILTGREIVLDLLGKLADLEGETSTPDDLEKWYWKKTGTAPLYSELLEALAHTAGERQELLHPYFEATAEEREEGIKQPTAAHHAIADLVRRGFIKVIITTNFDRMMEKALEQAGIVPKVLSTEEEVKGSIPLTHLDCCVFKVHGDYLDPHIRNTPEELAQYPWAISQLLDRVFDEYGLVVCGWSAEWDIALRNAICRCQSHRFTSYWTTRGEPSDTARRLIEHRQAKLISIVDADNFFQDIRDHVMSIEEFSAVHPFSVEVSVARMKRYLAEERHRIRLSDLIDHAVDNVLDQTTGDAFDTRTRRALNPSQLTQRVQSYTMATASLRELAALGGYWMQESQLVLWGKALDRLLSRGPSVTGGPTTVINLHRMPGNILLYALGLGAVAAGRLNCLKALFQTRVTLEDQFGNSNDALWAFFENQKDINWSDLEEDHVGTLTPLNDFMYTVLRPSGIRLGLDEQQYSLAFDQLDLSMALHMLQHPNDIVRYPRLIRCLNNRNWDRILDEIRDSLTEYSEESPYVSCGIFGSTAQQCSHCVDCYSQSVEKHRPRWARYLH